jgi:hypothetical protein
MATAETDDKLNVDEITDQVALLVIGHSTKTLYSGLLSLLFNDTLSPKSIHVRMTNEYGAVGGMRTVRRN